MERTCDIGKLLDSECNKLDFTRTVEIKNVSELSNEFHETLLWRADLLERKHEINIICKHHELLFGEAFERRNDKCCGVLKSHRRKVVGDRLVTLEMAQTLRTKGITVTPGKNFCRTCIAQYKTITADKETEPQEEAEPEDADEESIYEDFVCETPQKKVNISLSAVGVSPINLHGIPQHIRTSAAKAKLSKVMDKFKSDLSQAYDVNDIVIDTAIETPLRNDQIKAAELDRLHQAMIEKLKTASYPEKIQILTLVPDSWSRAFCATHFNVSEYLVRTARDLKKSKGILAVPNPKRGKTLSEETKLLVITFYEDDEYSRQLPGKKDCVSIGNKQYMQKRLVLCNLHELYIAFKEKYPDVKVGFSKFCALRPKWCVIAGSSGTHSVCVCTHHQNAVLLVDAINWEITYKDLTSKVVCDSENRICMMHRCEQCPGSDALMEFLNKELEDFEPDAEFHYSQWQTTDRSMLVTLTTTCDEYKQLLVETIDALTKHSYLAKCQGRFLKTKKENLTRSEAIVLGDFAENYQFIIQDEIQGYHWSKIYCTLHPVVIYMLDNDGLIKHDSLCYISNDNTHDTAFVYELQTMMAEYIKDKYPHIEKIHYFSDGCAGQYKNFKNFVNLCHHKQDFGLDALWTFFATSHGKSPCDGIGGFVKRHVAKRSLQRPLKDQILDYKSVLDVCRNDLTSIHFFDISQVRMAVVRESLVKRFEKGKTIPGTRSSHHFIPVSTSKISHQLTSEDTDFVGTFDFDNGDETNIVTPTPTVASYVSCVYDSFWWIGLVKSVSEEHGDVEVQFLHPHGPRKSFNWPSTNDDCFVPLNNILCSVSTPQTATATGRSYKILDNDYENTILAFEKFNNQ